MQHIGRRIGYLRVAELIGAPVRQLLLLREIDAEHFAGKILESVLVGISAGKTRGDLGAIDRRTP